MFSGLSRLHPNLLETCPLSSCKKVCGSSRLESGRIFFISFYFLPVFALLIVLFPLPPAPLYPRLRLIRRFSPFLSIGPFFKGELHSLYFNFIDEPPHPHPPP